MRDFRRVGVGVRWAVLLVLIATMLLGVPSRVAAAKGAILQCSRLPLYRTMTRVVYGHGEYIGLQDRMLQVSADGEDWSLRSTGVAASLSDLIFADGQFTAVGDWGRVLRSTDGRDWSLVSAGINEHLIGVAHGNGTYVAVSTSGTVAVSSDGSEWEAHSLGRESLRDVAYGDGLFVAVGSSGVFASRDGIEWERVHEEEHYATFLGVTYGQGRFAALLAEGTVLLSDDGRTWSRHPIPAEVIPFYPYLGDFTYGNGQFIVVGTDATLLLSSDGKTWSRAHLKMESSRRIDLRHVSVANGLMIATGDNGLILTSVDGQTWTERNRWTAWDHFLHDAAYGNGRFVTVGDHGLHISEDGYEWESCSLGEAYSLWSITFDGNRFLAAGWEWTEQRENLPRLFASKDGQSWSVYDPGTDRLLRAVTSNGRRMVAVGDGGTILSSVDGAAWSKSKLEQSVDLTDLLYAGGLFVAVGEEGTVLTSPDGLKWTAQESGVYGELTQVLYDGCQYTASTGSDWTASYDGERWTSARLEGSLDRLAVGGGWWAAADRGGHLSLSPDGSAWTEQPALVSDPVGGAYGDGKFVFVSPGGAVTVVEVPAGPAFSCNPSLADILRLDPAYGAIQAVVAAGLMQPDPDGMFRPDEDLTRAELAHLLVLAAGEEPTPKAKLPFTDAIDHPEAKAGYLQAAISLGLMEGLDDGRFYPDYPARLIDVVKGAAKAAGLAPLDHPPEGYVTFGDDTDGWVAAAVEAQLIGKEAPWPVWTDQFSLLRGFRVSRDQAAMVLGNLLIYQNGGTLPCGLRFTDLASDHPDWLQQE